MIGQLIISPFKVERPHLLVTNEQYLVTLAVGLREWIINRCNLPSPLRYATERTNCLI